MRRFDSNPRLQSFFLQLIAYSRVNPKPTVHFWIGFDAPKMGLVWAQRRTKSGQRISSISTHTRRYTTCLAVRCSSVFADGQLTFFLSAGA